MVPWVVKQHADGLPWLDNQLVVSCPGGQSCDVGLDLLLRGDEWQARWDSAGVICKAGCWTCYPTKRPFVYVYFRPGLDIPKLLLPKGPCSV